MQLKDRIKEAMEAAKLTKAALARATKASPGAITQWLSGETKSLKAETAAGIERATGYRASWIVDGKGEKLVASKSNQALTHVDTAQIAINKIASMADCLQFLATYLEALDAGDRAEALRMVARLGNEPEKHASVARSIEGMASAAFARAHQKAA